MTGYAFLRRIRHAWQAQNRHGVHSPFVYDFAENVLNKSSVPKDAALIAERHAVPLAFAALIARSGDYYGCSLEETQDDDRPRMFIIKPEDSFPEVREHDIIVVLHIHQNRQAAEAWADLAAKAALSIDLYVIGMLFFRSGFKEKTHFLMKKK